MSIEEIRGRVVSFAKEYYKNYNLAPPIAVICKEVGISSRKKLYQIFPTGEREICEKAGIPVPVERMRRRVENKCKTANNLRPVGTIKITDPRGYVYLPKLLRKEVGCERKGEIPFFMSANCVLLVRRDVDLKRILEGLDVLKKDLALRFQTGRIHD
jgi:hypothetical protein